MGSQVVLVFIPTPGAGHLVSALEMAKLLVAREPRLSITVLLLKLAIPNSPNPTAESLSSSTASDRIHFVDLPQDPIDPAQLNKLFFLGSFYESQRPHVRAAVTKIVSGSPRLAGFVLDMFCTTMMDVADEFSVPSYIFFTSNTAFLSLAFHLQDHHDEGKEDWSDSESIEVPGFTNPVPAKVIPAVLTDKAVAPLFDNLIKRIRKAKGLLVNTFAELEPGPIEALSLWDSKVVPSIYPVGPIISLSPGDGHARFTEADRKAEIVAWLDRQPPSSVVFLCFGSMGSFDRDQVGEIAAALERAGVRFLWSLRRPAGEAASRVPTEYDDPEEVLPEGFVDRTAGIGKVIGWAPQVTVLAHPAVGGFVSHCGWNSTLESIWHGVPQATWPLYAEQQLNAFEMVKELGLAVEITLDYRKEFGSSSSGVDDSKELIVEADIIEKGIRRLMEDGSEAIRKKVKEMSENSRKALLDGGSSFTSLSRFINEVVDVDNVA